MITDLVTAFNQLQTELNDLASHLLDTRPPHWVPLTEMEASLNMEPLGIGVDLISDLWYRDQQDGRETRSRHGLILADEHTQTLIQRVNACKDHFRTQVQQEKQDTANWRQALETLHEQPQPLREKLVIAGLSRIHLKQCFRHIPLLDTAPSRVGFSWYTNGRSIKTLTLQQAEKKLLDIGADKTHIQIQLEKLGQLRPDTRLAQVQTLAPTVRANLVFGDPADASGAKQRKAMNVAMPLFVPAQSLDQLLPEHNRIASEPPARHAAISGSVKNRCFPAFGCTPTCAEIRCPPPAQTSHRYPALRYNRCRCNRHLAGWYQRQPSNHHECGASDPCPRHGRNHRYSDLPACTES